MSTDPFSSDVFGGAGGRSRSPVPPIDETIDGALVDEVIDALMRDGEVRSTFRSSDSDIQVTTRLAGNHREWKYKLDVSRGGQPIVGVQGDYPLVGRIPRSEYEDEDRARNADRRAAKEVAEKHVEICRRLGEGLAQRLKPRRVPWVLVVVLVLIAVGLGVAGFHMIRDRGLLGPGQRALAQPQPHPQPQPQPQPQGQPQPQSPRNICDKYGFHLENCVR